MNYTDNKPNTEDFQGAFFLKIKRTTNSLLCLSAVAFSSYAMASDVRPFKNWDYGENIDSFPRSEGYYDCTADMGALALCKEQVSFLSYSHFAALYFNDDQELNTVSLTTDFSPDAYAAVVGALSREFSLVYMTGQGTDLDIVEQMKIGAIENAQEMEASVSRFESSQLTNGYLDLVYFENAYATQWQNYTDYQNMLFNTPEDIRAGEVFIYYDEVYGPSMEVSFSLPGKSLERNKQQVQNAPIEDF